MHAAFLYVRFRFVLYWSKPTSAKAARRTLVKLTPGLLCKVYSIKVERKFVLSLLNKLGVILLVKLNGTKECLPTQFWFASLGW